MQTRMLLSTALALSAMIVASVAAYALFPPASRLPMQWNLSGGVNWFAPRLVALAFTPVLAFCSLACVWAISDSRGSDTEATILIIAITFCLAHAIHLWFVRKHLTR